MEEEMGLVGATADDTEAELIRNICEMELLNGKKNCWVIFSPDEITCTKPRGALPIGKQILAAFVPLSPMLCPLPSGLLWDFTRI